MSETRAAGSDGGLLLGVDIGGTKILAGLVDHAGRVVERRQRPTRPTEILDDTVEACRDLLRWADGAQRAVAGIGVGAKGAVDSRRGRLVGSLYLGHGEIPMGDHLRHVFGLPVRLENDVHAATIGEQMFGIGRHVDDFVFYNAGTGIAIGIVAAGQLYRGASNTAGETGHAVIDHSGLWPCPCGMTGCVETMIVAGRRGARLPELPGLTVCEGQDGVGYSYLASNLRDVIDIFDPAAVVLAGGMLNSCNPSTIWLVDQVATSIGLSMGRRGIDLRPAFAGSDAGLVGAAALLVPEAGSD